MKARHWGRVIGIAPIMGLVNTAEQNDCPATNAAILGLAPCQRPMPGKFNATGKVAGGATSARQEPSKKRQPASGALRGVRPAKMPLSRIGRQRACRKL